MLRSHQGDSLHLFLHAAPSISTEFSSTLFLNWDGSTHRNAGPAAHPPSCCWGYLAWSEVNFSGRSLFSSFRDGDSSGNLGTSSTFRPGLLAEAAPWGHVRLIHFIFDIFILFKPGCKKNSSSKGAVMFLGGLNREHSTWRVVTPISGSSQNKKYLGEDFTLDPRQIPQTDLTTNHRGPI